MNREQRRKAGKGMDNEVLDITGLVVHFKNGQYVNLDTSKVMINDRVTGKPLFEEVLEATPKKVETSSDTTTTAHVDGQTVDNYSVTFDTPDGPMEYVKNGNWSGVRKAK